MENSSSNMKGNQKRILKELQTLMNSPLDHVKVFPSAEDVTFWKVLMIGPKDTFYNNGCYLLSF